MAEFTRCLLELPKFTVNDVRRLVRLFSSTPQSKMDKGFKFYVSSYICNYEDLPYTRLTVVSCLSRPPSILKLIIMELIQKICHSYAT
ncbi:hypothetical protein WMY93_017284 [Mugilogobius chulae]|uniref:Uncharacterized protein n=1 Tax=Mugilogobius chulae TaxID=88201 RepID=A0AAW0NY10_9GOBI